MHILRLGMAVVLASARLAACRWQPDHALAPSPPPPAALPDHRPASPRLPSDPPPPPPMVSPAPPPGARPGRRPREPQEEEAPATVTSVLSTSVSVSVSVSTATETSVAVSTTTATTTDATRVVPIFYLDERAFEGLPYTLLHRVCGHVVGVDGDGGATTFVLTTTRVDLAARPSTTAVSSVSPTANTANTTVSSVSPTANTAPPTASIITAASSWTYNATGAPSTITQGPTTYVFTGTRWGDPARTIVNQCRLTGTSAAHCNLTHLGPAWYTDNNPQWNGTYSTYNYTWTSGDRYGFAPCTVTQGVNLMGPPQPTAVAATSSSGGAGGRLVWPAVAGLGRAWVVLVLGVWVVL